MFNEENISSIGRANKEYLVWLWVRVPHVLYFFERRSDMQNFMEKFKEYLKFDEEHLGGPHKVYKFPNNYGASVIKNPYSYGGEQGLWEVGGRFL